MISKSVENKLIYCHVSDAINAVYPDQTMGVKCKYLIYIYRGCAVQLNNNGIPGSWQ